MKSAGETPFYDRASQAIMARQPDRVEDIAISAFCEVSSPRHHLILDSKSKLMTLARTLIGIWGYLKILLFSDRFNGLCNPSPSFTCLSAIATTTSLKLG